MDPENLAIFNLIVNGGQLVALIVFVFKAGKWVGAVETSLKNLQDRRP